MNAIPKVIFIKLNPRPLLGDFIDKNFAYCSRVDVSAYSIQHDSEQKL